MKKTLKTTAMVLAIAVLLGISGFTIYKVESDNARSVAVAVISQGSRGETVKLIQQKLKRWGYYNGAIDGIYGSATKKAVKNFQSKKRTYRRRNRRQQDACRAWYFFKRKLTDE